LDARRQPAFEGGLSRQKPEGYAEQIQKILPSQHEETLENQVRLDERASKSTQRGFPAALSRGFIHPIELIALACI